jgi:hypothetical protein
MVYSGGFYFSNIINSLRDLQSGIVKKEKYLSFRKPRTMLKFLTFLSFLFAFQVSSQLKLAVKVVDFKQNKSVLPKTFNIYQSMIAHKGYVLEFTLTNT